VSSPGSSDSSEPLEVQIDDLSTAGTNFEDLAGTLTTFVSNLSNSLNALGEPWGSDDMGKKFADGATGYLVSKDSLVGASGALSSFESIFSVYGSEIVDAAAAFQSGDDAYGEEFIDAIGGTGSSGGGTGSSSDTYDSTGDSTGGGTGSSSGSSGDGNSSTSDGASGSSNSSNSDPSGSSNDSSGGSSGSNDGTDSNGGTGGNGGGAGGTTSTPDTALGTDNGAYGSSGGTGSGDGSTQPSTSTSAPTSSGTTGATSSGTTSPGTTSTTSPTDSNSGASGPSTTSPTDSNSGASGPSTTSPTDTSSGASGSATSGNTGPYSYSSTPAPYSRGTENSSGLPDSELPGASATPGVTTAGVAEKELSKGAFEGEQLAHPTGLSQSTPRAGMQQGGAPYSPSSGQGSSGGKSPESDRKKRRGATKGTSEQSVPYPDSPEENGDVQDRSR